MDDGAIGDGVTDNTQSIRHTLLRAMTYNLPSIVLVPAGDFLTGSLQIPSNVSFHLARNAIIRASDNASLYSCIPSMTSDTGPCDYPFLLVDHAHSASLEGEGRIDGGANSPPGHLVRGYRGIIKICLFLLIGIYQIVLTIIVDLNYLLFVTAHSIIIMNITITNSPFWTTTIIGK